MPFIKKRNKKKKKGKKYLLKSQVHQPDWWLVGLTIALTLFGLVMVANVSAAEAFRDFGDKFYYFRLQARWVLLGFLIFWGATIFPYQKWQKLTALLLFLALTSLVLVLLPRLGFRVFGARRWLSLGGIRFQPSEIVKLSFIIYLSAYLVKKKNPLPLLLISGLIVFLVMLQPDLGTTVIILASGFVVYFISGAPWWHVFLAGLGGLLGGVILVFFSSYRRERFLTFLNPLRDPLGASYHIRQILIALGSGGIFGLGLGQSRQKYEYLPAVTTDSIFAVIAEELGFIGASVLILVFVFLIWRGFKIALLVPDRFGQLLAIGIISWVGIQALVNLGAMVALVPLTGMPLPFISYGGSSLVLALTGAGILVNISKNTIKKP
jgi:cell division protein FtsW